MSMITIYVHFHDPQLRLPVLSVSYTVCNCLWHLLSVCTATTPNELQRVTKRKRGKCNCQ